MKQWLIKCLLTFYGVLLGIFALVYVFDPYFHYHHPFSWVSYRLYEERYINDGISRNFEFDTLITGTSMAQNFKPSEAEALFGGKAVKETFSGSGFQETSDNIRRALQRNEKITKVIWSCEYNGLIREWDWKGYEGYPTYLYDDNPFNDVSYVFNKSILYHGVLTNIVNTILRLPSTTMDEYSSWEKETGLKYILQSYNRDSLPDELPSILFEYERTQVFENISKNVIALANDYPDIDFYIFYTPYSICFWDSLSQANALERQFQAEQIATELMLQCPNIKLFNFFDQYEVITNLNNYRDKEHYASWINSQILEWMASGVGLVTKDNYLEKLAAEREFYCNFDYESIYE